jgi:hypothetical protein
MNEKEIISEALKARKDVLERANLADCVHSRWPAELYYQKYFAMIS